MMARSRQCAAPRDIGALFRVGATGGLTDEQLLERFVGRDREAADIAFGNLNTVEDFSRHPHLRRLTTLVASGAVAVPVPPALDDDAAPARVPRRGEQSEALRREFAG